MQSLVKGMSWWQRHILKIVIDILNSTLNNGPQHKALENNYRVCGVYSSEPCAEVLTIVLGWILIYSIKIGLFIAQTPFVTLSGELYHFVTHLYKYLQPDNRLINILSTK